ncbi:MAG TPA: GNAT family N-acetyltransferase [Acidimicrobiales bacterium]|nr:GNAT family N-acetyltransferase [Acidimicrobiales bacterium]
MPGPASEDFVRARTADVTLRDGGHIRVRPVAPGDKERLVDGLRRLSPASRYRRFLAPTDHLSADALAYLTELDYHDHFAWGAVDLDEPGEPGVGVARYVRLRDDPEAAEVAVAVVDDHQRRGIGGLLLRLVAMSAREHGIRRLVATVMADNEPVREVLRDLGADYRLRTEQGRAVIEVPVPEPTEEMAATSLFGLLRLAAGGDLEVRPAGR